MPVLSIIIGSTRPGRVGKPVADWFRDEAVVHGGFQVEVADLADLDLPLFDEPHHPRLADYQHEHTRRWSAIVARADAVVFVTPEYNHSFNAATKNAIDYLQAEWALKPAAIVSYGGVSAGTRAAAALRVVLSALGMLLVPGAVNIPFVATMIGPDGTLAPPEETVAAAKTLLDQLVRTTRSGLSSPAL